jgi:maltooligosyltrehalose trehalohydrolase
MTQTLTRQLPIGTELTADGAHFRVWAPECRSVRVEFESSQARSPLELAPDEPGYFSGLASDAAAGDRYRLRLDGGNELWPDPASRFQAEGPEGASELIDPSGFIWDDSDWPGASIAGQVFYEMHVGTFTSEGTWPAAARQLPELARLGITVVELMPVAEFPGKFGWSYDGANQFAPTHLYGSPDDFRRFVDEAHRCRIAVILDVVYNHLGAIGERLLRPFSAAYFSRSHKNDWGSAINFDGDECGPVREFFLANVRHWIVEYHLDGLRIDATQAFHDRSKSHILRDLAQEARSAAGGRKIIVAGESEPQRAELLRSADVGGCELDALANDDFHHAAMVRLTGRREAYYSDYEGSAEEFIACAKWGYLFQGQRYAWQDNPRGTPALDVKAERFINFLQNHDQLANSPTGLRAHELTSRGRFRAMTALFLLAPQTPMLFQGQEFAASSPFFYFNDCAAGDAGEVARGRAKFLSQFPSYALPEVQAHLPAPSDPDLFRRCKLDFGERQRHAQVYALHLDLLRLRREDPVLRQHDAARIHGATLGPDAFLLRFLPEDPEVVSTRLLIVNFGPDLRRESISQPLIAPPNRTRWNILWSSEDSRYGGTGTPPLETPKGWQIPGETAVVLHPEFLE